MTVEQLFLVLEQTIRDGYGDAPVYFDTEAKEFKYHLAKIGHAWIEPECDVEPIFVLYEKRAPRE